MDRYLAQKKKSITSLILIIGLLVVGVGAYVINKEGILFLFGEKAAPQNYLTITGVIKSTASSTCYKIMPESFRNVPYVLEGTFPVLTPQTNQNVYSRKGVSLVKSVEAAPVATTSSVPRTTTGPRPTPSRAPVPSPVPTPINYGFTSSCRPLYATSSMVQKLLNQKVTVTGVLNGIILYVSRIESSSVPTPTAITECEKLRGYCVAASSCADYGKQIGTGYLCGNVPYSCCSSSIKSTPVPVKTSSPAPQASMYPVASTYPSAQSTSVPR